MIRKKTLGDKIDAVCESIFWTVYILYVPLCLLFFSWMLIAEFIVPLF